MTIKIPNIAVVGCGDWGKNLVRNYHELSALAAIATTADDSSNTMQGLYDVPVRSMTDILADDSIDGVVIATPSDKHYKLARVALMAGKHTFVEKPLVHTTKQAQELCELAEERGLTLMVGHLLRYHPAFLKVQELVNEGRIGTLHHMAASRLNLGKILGHENILWDLAPHDLSMAMALFGEVPHSVQAVGQGYCDRTLEDIVTVSLGFSNHRHATISLSRLSPYKEQRLVLQGTDGMILFDDTESWGKKLQFFNCSIDNAATAFKQPRQDVIIPLDEGEPLKEECKHFIDCIRNGIKPLTDGYEALKGIQILEQADACLKAKIGARKAG